MDTGLEYIKFLPADSSSFNLQQCTHLPHPLRQILKLYETRLEEYISICLSPCNDEDGGEDLHYTTRILTRISAIRTTTANPVDSIITDMRVRELCVTEDLKSRISKRYPKLNQLDVIIALSMKDMLCDYWEQNKKFIVKVPTGLFTEAPTAECGHEVPARVLKCGVIRRMTVTVIFNDLTQLQRHHQSSNQFSEEVIRDSFKTYSLHVKANTLVDLRECPFLSALPGKISLIFVHDCFMTNSQTEIGIGRISNQTEINVRRNHDVLYFQRILMSLSDHGAKGRLPGLGTAYKELESAFELERPEYGVVPRKHFYSGFLLGGASGSGKKLLVREVTRRHCAKLFVCNLALEEKTIRQNPEVIATKLTRIFEDAEQTVSICRYPVVILLENLDVLHVSASGIPTRSVRNKKTLTNHICNCLDRVGISPSTGFSLPFVVIATTSKPYLTPEKLRLCHRLYHEIFIKVPDVSQRIDILASLQVENPELHSLDMESLAKRTPGYVASDLVRLLDLAIQRARETQADAVFEEQLKYSLSRVLPSVLQGSLGLVSNPVSGNLDHISGLDTVKMDLIKTIVWPLTVPEAFRRMGIEPSRGIILYGPPGCGKTTLVRAVASSHQANFISVSSAELFSSGVGDSEKIIAHLFHRARLASPCILFIDELDSIVGSRESKSATGKSVSEAILSMLLTEMDGIGVRSPFARSTRSDKEATLSFEQRFVVVGATNRPDMIDTALLRPGRFDRLVPVPPPNEADRLKLLAHSTRGTPLGDDVVLEEIAEKTERFSGADIINLCREAGLFALSENMNIPSVSMMHFRRALAQASPSISEEYLDAFYEYASRGSRTTEDLAKQINSLHLS